MLSLHTSLFLLALVAPTHAHETVQCSFVHEIANDAKTSFALSSNCTVPPESTLYLGACLWESSSDADALHGGGAYLVPQQYAFHQESNTDCGCVTTLSDTHYEQSCAIYLTLGSSNTIQHLGTAISRWTTAFQVGTFVVLDVSFQQVEAEETAQLPVALKLYDAETFATRVDLWEPLVLGQLLYVAVETEILGAGELHIDRVALCNLADLDAKGVLCGDLYTLDTKVVGTLNHLETRMVSVLNLPYTVDGVWHLHVIGGVSPRPGRRLLQTEPGVEAEAEEERPFRASLGVVVKSPEQASLADATASQPPATVQGVQLETVALILLGMGGALGGSYYITQRRAGAAAKAASNLTNVSATQAEALTSGAGEEQSVPPPPVLVYHDTRHDLACSGLSLAAPPVCGLSTFAIKVQEEADDWDDRM
jgi:hypothetical protein